MGQLIIAVLVTVTIVAFGMANGHHVAMSAVVGDPIRIRLFFLLAIFYIAGAMTTFFYALFARVVRRAERLAQHELAPDASTDR